MPDANVPVFLQNNLVILRPLMPEDHNAAYLAWLNDPEVNRYSQRRFWPSSDSRAKENGALMLAICHKPTGRHVGNISLGPINWLHSCTEISILIGDKAAWNTGIGRQAVYLLSRHALLTLGLHRVEAGSANPAFNKMVEKLGWTTEGCKRKRFRLDSEWLDVIQTSLLRDEWHNIPEYEPASA